VRFWIAWQLLTIIPSPYHRRYGIENLGKATAFFPVVGLILGLVLFGLDHLLTSFLPSILINVFLCSIFGGLTGDSYGAINEFTEVAVLVLICIIGQLGGISWLSSFLF